MNRARVNGIANPAALFIMQVLLSCGAVDQGPGAGANISDDATMGTDFPKEAPDEEAVNPQRNPELWSRPSDVASGDEDTRSDDAPAQQPAVAGEEPYALAGVPFRGVNLSAAELGSALPGTFGEDYTFPTRTEVDYFLGKGMNTFRVGFKWERLQPAARSAFDGAYFERLDGIVAYATSKGANVILNPHNFARYYGDVVGSEKVPDATFADLWRRLAEKYKASSKVLFDLVNEPHDMPTEQWVGAANAAIAAIRAAGATNLVLVPGNGWTGAYSWNESFYGTPNAKAMLAISDPKDNLAFEAHQYMDSDASGGTGTCVSDTIGRERLEPFVRWLRENKKRGFLGELAGGNNTTCEAALKKMLDFVHASSDVMIGWTWWGGGPWWGEYPFTLNPKDGVDRPQMALLTPYLKR